MESVYAALILHKAGKSITAVLLTALAWGISILRSFWVVSMRGIGG